MGGFFGCAVVTFTGSEWWPGPTRQSGAVVTERIYWVPKFAVLISESELSMHSCTPGSLVLKSMGFNNVCGYHRLMIFSSLVLPHTTVV